MKFFNIKKHLVIFFLLVFLLVNLITSKGYSGWLFYGNNTFKSQPIDKELKSFLSFYDLQLKNKVEANKYKEIFISAYNLLVDNYVYSLSSNKKTEILQYAKESILKKEKTLTDQKKEITSKDLAYTALRAVYSHLDPHTAWLDPDENTLLKNSIDGEYFGVGIVLGGDPNVKYIKAINVIEDGPADKAGVKDGDLIYKIDDKVYLSNQLELAAKVLKGKEHSKLKLEVIRGKEHKIFTIKRGRVNLKTVYIEKIYDKYSYIKITSFNYNTTSEFRRALKKLDINKSEGLILDLRNNPGGLLYSSLIICDMFVKEGLLLAVKGRNESLNTSYYATKNANIDIPIVILTNNFTASAAEIVSAALQQNNRAIVMGQQTFGKGSVQTIYELKDGSAAKITIQLFYTPKGYALQGIGVVPDILINCEHKNSFYNIRESSYNNKLIVKHIKYEFNPKLNINESTCKPYGENQDKEIGCAIEYFQGKFKLK